MKTGIVCEGGGMRGTFTAGVLQAFMDKGFMADELIGVSAGASNGVSYISGQKERGYRTNVGYAGDKRYVSKRNYLKTGSLFGMDFIFGEIPEKLDPFDYKAFHASPCDFFAGATNVETGKIEYFGKDEIQPGLTALKASCSLPVFSKIIDYKGKKYLDGGTACPIPVEKAIETGCEKMIIILTQARGYKKEPQGFRFAYARKYKQYPQLVKAMDKRHTVYNETLARIEYLERSGKAIVIAPIYSLSVDRFGKDRNALIDAYKLGTACGLEALKII